VAIYSQSHPPTLIIFPYLVDPYRKLDILSVKEVT
jgi:hypothetical protein